MQKKILAGLCFAVVIAAQMLVAQNKNAGLAKIDPNSPENAGRKQFNEYLNGLAMDSTAKRHVAVAALSTQKQAEARQAEVRREIVSLIGGLPPKTPLKAQITGSTEADGYRIEKLIFESQPGYLVPALLYLPTVKPAAGRFPAIVIAPGHSAKGKASDFYFAASFVKNGFAVLSYDPIGQGERLQYLDTKTGESLAIRSTGEHAEAALQPALVGDAIARYFVQDGIGAVDYLSSRPEIDSNRIGAFGCSGGGADTALLSALDPRIKATGTACYTTSFDALLSSIGPQDAEQSIPGFIAAGLDLPDWMELAAPRAYAIIATTEDMFPFAGAVNSEAEVRSFYRLFNADKDLEFITGPGGHGNLGPIRGQILSFFLKHLQPGSDFEDPILPELPQAGSTTLPDGLTAAAFQVTPTGQIATSYPKSETVHSLNLKRANQLAPLPKQLPLASLQKEVRAVTHSSAIPLTAGRAYQQSKVSFEEPSIQDGAISFQRGVMHSDEGVDVHFQLATPAGIGKVPAVLLLTNTATGNDFDTEMRPIAASGKVVLAIAPRPSPSGKEESKAPILGPFYMAELRAEFNGRTILGMRVDDCIRAVDFLASNARVDAKQITAKASGHLGLVLLHAATLDARISHLDVDHALVSYRSLVELPMPVDAPEDILPGVLRHYDLPELANALGRRLTLSNPQQGSESPSEPR